MICPTVRMDAEMYETLGTSRRIASTSSSESFELDPRPARAPEDVIVPGMTIRKFVPRERSWFSACSLAPSPIPTTATTQATPMMIPSAVRSDRSLLRDSARKATLRVFPVLVTARSSPAGERLVEDLQGLVDVARAHDEWG